MTYVLVRQAILKRVSLTAVYESHVRHFSPHILGKRHNGVPIVVAFQYGGGGLSPSGEWCEFLVPRLHYVRVNGDKWQAGPIVGMPVAGFNHIDVAA